MRKIALLDVDGTLIGYDGKCPESAKEAIRKARENGHLVYICTGCSKYEIVIKNWDFELDGMIGGNGCYVESNGVVVYHRPLTLEECTHFVDWCNANDLAFRLECNEGIYASDTYYQRSIVTNLRYKLGEDAVITEEMIASVPKSRFVTEGANLYRTDCNKTAFVLNSIKDYENAVKEFPTLKVGTWGGKGEHPLYGDVGPVVDKKSGIKILLDYLKDDGSNTVGFGDAKSDIPMFEACSYSVAMGNSGPECIAAADYVTDDLDQNGIYNAFEKLGFFEKA